MIEVGDVYIRKSMGCAGMNRSKHIAIITEIDNCLSSGTSMSSYSSVIIRFRKFCSSDEVHITGQMTLENFLKEFKEVNHG
jgi:hypothetical protein